MASRRIGRFLVSRVLGIDVNQRYAAMPPDLDRTAADILQPADTYTEEEPTVKEWLGELTPTLSGVLHYVQTLFPSASWIRRYNLRWLLGDVLAGITIGLVVVPQAMAYAVLAGLSPAYGLYTSFTGAALYWLFGTSRDIVIGATAVGSLLVGQVIARLGNASNNFTREETANALSMMVGAVLLFFGLFRLGWIIEFIPYIAISAFVTSAAITIMSTQIPTALGIPDIDTSRPPVWVLINTIKSLPNIHLDAAIGLSSIILLFAVKEFCSIMEVRQPAQKRMWSLISSLRLTFTMLLFTLISFLVHRDRELRGSKFRIVGTIERGFQRAHIPQANTDLLKLILPELPAVVIVLVIEHIAIAKAMGRLHNYTINPSQEMVALGAANMFSPFVGGYVCTGSFGASAVLSKAGVRSPLAGLFSATILVLALYALTPVFYYIPKAALAGLIIHAVSNLLASLNKLFGYWQMSPVEFIIWITCVVIAIFTTLEAAVYTGTILSMVLLLFRLARTRGRFLGRVRARRVVGEKNYSGRDDVQSIIAVLEKENDSTRDIFLPLDRKDASNPKIQIECPYSGVFVYRLSEGYNFTNQAYHAETLSKHVMENTKRMSEDDVEKESDRLWNDPGPRGRRSEASKNMPLLRAIVLDFSAVNHLDITSVQGLVDLRNSFDRYASPDAVEWHFAHLQNRWTRRALSVAGFGFPTALNPSALKAWKPVYSFAAVLEDNENDGHHGRGSNWDEEHTSGSRTPVSITDTISIHNRTSDYLQSRGQQYSKMASIYATNRPFFHADLNDAVDCAVRDARCKDDAFRMT